MKPVRLLPLVSASLLAPTLLLAQGGPYAVQGQLSSKLAPTRAYLRYQVGEVVKIDSTSLTKGRFTFKGAVDAPTRAVLLVTKPGKYFNGTIAPSQRLDVYLEPGTVRVLSADSLTHATLAGTPSNVDQTRLMALTRLTTERMDALMKEYRGATEAQRKDKAFEASIDQRYEAIENDQRALLKQFIQSAPQSQVSVAALGTFAGYNIDPATAGPLYEGLAPAVRQSPAGQAFGAKLDKARQLAIGAVAPDFSQADASGKQVKLSDFRGKYVLVDFWASWCGPCRRENPNVVANFNQYKSRNFTILGVSLDQPSGREAWLKAIDADGLAWTQVSDLKFWKNEVAQLYGIQSIPQNLLIGPDGRIVAKNLHGEGLGQKLAAVLSPTGAQ